jgi:hypothetical protein
MKPATISEIKKTLFSLENEEVIELCLRLIKYKKENKELLHYLLFESSDKTAFLNKAKREIELMFEELNHSNAYLLKKGLRKILKLAYKYAKHVGEEDFEVDVLIYFCQLFKKQIPEAKRNVVLSNIFEIQKKKVEKIVAKLHEDFQYDYGVVLENL